MHGRVNQTSLTHVNSASGEKSLFIGVRSTMGEVR